MADTLKVVPPGGGTERATHPPPDDLFAAAGVKKGDILAGRYRVEDVLGVGGMGAVVSTVHVQLGTRFAIKLVRPAALRAEYVVERFLREARAASRLTSPNVARIFDIGRLENGCPYMVMELLEGHDLKSLLHKNGGPLDPAMAADCIAQACRALAEAHLGGIVHRDLKPSNLFLVTRGPQAGTVKVLDFGISKFLVPAAPEDAQVLTNPETTLGSPRYMAPEQLARPNEVDERVDVWSLGVTLYELLVGKAPFRGPTDEYIARAVMLEYPSPPSRARPGVPEELSAVVMRCLEKDRAARYPTASALAEALTRAMGRSAPPAAVAPPAVPVAPTPAPAAAEPIAPTLVEAGPNPFAAPPAGMRPSAHPSAPPNAFAAPPAHASAHPPAHHSSAPPNAFAAPHASAHPSAPPNPSPGAMRASHPSHYPSVPPPPRVPMFSGAPAATQPPADAGPVSLPRRGWRGPLLGGALAVVVLGVGGAWLVLRERAPSHTTPLASVEPTTTPSATPAPSGSGSVALAPLPVDSTPVPIGSGEKLKNVTSSVDPRPTGAPAKDPLCTAASIVCNRAYPECTSLRDYCEGKAHPASVDAGAPTPNEHPVCTAARIVCDHRLEECDSLTRKCLVAQQGASAMP